MTKLAGNAQPGETKKKTTPRTIERTPTSSLDPSRLLSAGLVREPPVGGSRHECLRRVREIVVAGDDAVELVLEPVEGVALELADTLPREAELLADRLE